MSSKLARLPESPRGIDTAVQLVAPERLKLEFLLAGPFRRFVAYVLDQCLLLFLVVAVFWISFAVSQGEISGFGPGLIGYFLITWGYGAFCESAFNGRTLGKWACGLRVISHQGNAITATQAILRNVVGTVDGPLPFWFLLGLASMISTRRFQRIGDLAAGTFVVGEFRRTSPRPLSLNKAEFASILELVPRRIAAGSRLSRVLSDYVHRRSRFSRTYLEEIAEPLARPLRKRYGLPSSLTADQVLCSLYLRIFS
jgi:uncharacterized RDD family membrane protein YckC